MGSQTLGCEKSGGEKRTRLRPTARSPLTMILNSADAVKFCASFTSTVNSNVPADSGMPETTPAEVRFNPGGKLPAFKLHSNGPTPPVATSLVTANGNPGLPFGSFSEHEEIWRGATSQSVSDDVFELSAFEVAVTLTLTGTVVSAG